MESDFKILCKPDTFQQCFYLVIRLDSRVSYQIMRWKKNKHQGTSMNRSFGHWIKYKIDKHWKKKYFYGIMYLSSAIS